MEFPPRHSPAGLAALGDDVRRPHRRLRACEGEAAQCGHLACDPSRGCEAIMSAGVPSALATIVILGNCFSAASTNGVAVASVRQLRVPRRRLDQSTMIRRGSCGRSPDAPAGPSTAASWRAHPTAGVHASYLFGITMSTRGVVADLVFIDRARLQLLRREATCSSTQTTSFC